MDFPRRRRLALPSTNTHLFLPFLKKAAIACRECVQHTIETSGGPGGGRVRHPGFVLTAFFLSTAGASMATTKRFGRYRRSRDDENRASGASDANGLGRWRSQSGRLQPSWGAS